MTSLALYCKSYQTDLWRVVRLLQSIERFNETDIPVYVSVPERDIPLFQKHLDPGYARLIPDEEILRASPNVNLARVAGLPGSMSQQIVKSEFWRLGLSDAYVCLDSDAVFIRSFSRNDFLAPDGFPYTVLDEAHDLLESAMHQGRYRIIEAFEREANQMQEKFERVGRRYSFGPFPVVWHKRVWQSLEEAYFQPRSMSIVDALQDCPIESRWYGEALLAYRSIPLNPCQALFKVYHYAWQLDADRGRGVTNEGLARFYCGVIYQSAWERNMDWPSEGGGRLSRMGRQLRRFLGRI